LATSFKNVSLLTSLIHIFDHKKIKMSWRISFHIIGDTFDPRKINVAFDEQNLATDIAKSGRLAGQVYGYGSAFYTVPKAIPRLQKFKHLADLFEPLLAQLQQQGADNWWIDIGRLYSQQCNEELGIEELMQITRLKCSLAYSAYAVTEAEEMTGFD
jgi:hypothetical protein